jgi:hypothetical protein
LVILFIQFFRAAVLKSLIKMDRSERSDVIWGKDKSP